MPLMMPSILMLVETTLAATMLLRDDANQAVKTLPPERGGQELVGEVWPQLSFDAWLGTPDDEPHKGELTLYRWWTDGCPYCEKSLPAIEQLRREFQRFEGQLTFRVVAVYHPKPPRELTEADHQFIRDAAKARGYEGAIALDCDWSELRRVWLDSAPRDATSVSFLIERPREARDDSGHEGGGVIRFVHPGPQFFPSDDPACAQDNADFVMLREAIRTLLESDDQRSAQHIP